MTSTAKLRFFVFLNAIEVVGILFVLTMAFGMQFIFNELPCPLCLLQRVGFVGISVALLMNLRYRIRPRHYALALLSALFAAFVSIRQILLHIVPGTGAYGSPIFGYHLYTWSFIVSMCVVIYTAILLGFEVQSDAEHFKQLRWKWITHTLFALIFAVTVANVVSAYFDCGPSICPENPTHYS